MKSSVVAVLVAGFAGVALAQPVVAGNATGHPRPVLTPHDTAAATGLPVMDDFAPLNSSPGMLSRLSSGSGNGNETKPKTNSTGASNSSVTPAHNGTGVGKENNTHAMALMKRALQGMPRIQYP